jgi:hypothetical protein
MYWYYHHAGMIIYRAYLVTHSIIMENDNFWFGWSNQRLMLNVMKCDGTMGVQEFVAGNGCFTCS